MVICKAAYLGIVYNWLIYLLFHYFITVIFW